MPGGDGTGPAGMGPMTGRAAGYCAGYGVPGYMNPIPGGGYWGAGRGFGGGRGRRGGWRNWYRATGMPGWARAQAGLPAWGGQVGVPVAYPAYGAPYSGGYNGQLAYGPPTPEQEVDMLQNQAEYLEQMVENINQRIEELEEQSTNSSVNES
ncbi:MAG: DUF5320 domain-containing protein [Planctomycetota bacterium]